jgi:hypothetical protein
MMKNTKPRKLRRQKKQPSQLKQITTKTVQISNILKMDQVRSHIENILKMAQAESDIEKKINLLREQFTAAYPRIEDKPEMALMFEQLIELYRDADEVHQEIKNFNPDNYDNPKQKLEAGRQRGIARKIWQSYIHEIGSILVKMGFTYCSMKNIPVDDRATANPKAVAEIRRSINKLRERMEQQAKDALPLPPGATEAEQVTE